MSLHFFGVANWTMHEFRFSTPVADLLSGCLLDLLGFSAGTVGVRLKLFQMPGDTPCLVVQVMFLTTI